MDIDNWCVLNSHPHPSDSYGNKEFCSGKLGIFGSTVAGRCSLDLMNLDLNLGTQNDIFNLKEILNSVNIERGTQVELNF